MRLHRGDILHLAGTYQHLYGTVQRPERVLGSCYRFQLVWAIRVRISCVFKKLLGDFIDVRRGYRPSSIGHQPSTSMKAPSDNDPLLPISTALTYTSITSTSLPVAQAIEMPSAPPIASLSDTYSNASCPRPLEPCSTHTHSSSSHCSLNDNDPTANCTWFTPSERTLLTSQCTLPLDFYRSSLQNSTLEPRGPLHLSPLNPTSLTPEPILITSSGVPIFSYLEPSLAESTINGYSGISSSDSLLHLDT